MDQEVGAGRAGLSEEEVTVLLAEVAGLAEGGAMQCWGVQVRMSRVEGQGPPWRQPRGKSNYKQHTLYNAPFTLNPEPETLDDSPDMLWMSTDRI